MSEDETIKVQGQPISKLQKCRKMNFVEFDRIFVIEVSYESPEKNKQDGTKFMSVIQHFHVEKLTFLKTDFSFIWPLDLSSKYSDLLNTSSETSKHYLSNGV